MPVHPSAIIAEKAQQAMVLLEELHTTRGVREADRFALASARLDVQRVRDRHRFRAGLQDEVRDAHDRDK